MEITINSELNIDIFVRSYLTFFIKNLFINSVDPFRLSRFNDFINANAYNVLIYCLSNLFVSKVGNTYIIKPNYSLKYNNIPIKYYINIITYGNRSFPGYKILLNVFRYVSENINEIYEEYENGY